MMAPRLRPEYMKIGQKEDITHMIHINGSDFGMEPAIFPESVDALRKVADTYGKTLVTWEGGASG